jgi:hypothetical protein
MGRWVEVSRDARQRKGKERSRSAEVSLTYLRTYVTGSSYAVLSEVGRTTGVSLVGAHHGSEGASGHSFGTPPRGPAGTRQPRSLD